MRVSLLIALAIVFLPLQSRADDFKIHISPKQPKACSYLSIGWEGEVQRPSSAQLKISNERDREAIVWASPLVSFDGYASHTFQVPINQNWVLTNLPSGAAYRAELFVDDKVQKQVGFPVLDHGPNLAPTTQDLAYYGNEDQNTEGTLFAADADGDILTFALEHDSEFGHTSVDPETGSFVFTPYPNWSGETSFVYRVQDCESAVFGVAYITVNPVNDPPSTTSQTIVLHEDASTSATLVAVDIDTASLYFALSSTPDNITLTLSSAGVLSLSPGANWNGEASAWYTVSDGEYAVSGMVSVIVLPVNDVPVAHPGAVTGDASSTIAGTLYGQDIEGDIEFHVTTQPPLGQLDVNPISGAFVYSPAAGWSGQTSFGFRVFDGEAYSDPAIVTINVVAVDSGGNQPPVLSNANFVMKQGERLGGLLLASDADGDKLTFRIASGTSVGDVYVEPVAGYFTFAPDPLFAGETRFQVAANDGTAETQAVITVVVEPKINQPPSVTDVYFEISPYANGSGYIPATDPDGDQLSYRLISSDNALWVSSFNNDGSFKVAGAQYGAVGTWTFTFEVSDGFSQVRATAHVTVTSSPSARIPIGLDSFILAKEDTIIRGQFPGVDPNLVRSRFDIPDWASLPSDGLYWSLYNNWFTYYPPVNFFGDVEFTYLVSDDISVSTGNTITIRVQPVNDPPVVQSAHFTSVEGQSVTGSLIARDQENDSFVYFVDDESPHGSVEIDRFTGEFTFTPKPGWTGKTFFSVKAFDSEPSIQDGLVTVEIVSRPRANDVWFPGWEDQIVTGKFSAFDPNFNYLAYSIVTAPTIGTVSLNEEFGITTFTYTPPPNWNGEVEFYYQASNGVATSVPAKATVNMAATNDAPMLEDQSVSLVAGATLTGLLAASDNDGADASYVVVQSTQYGLFLLNEATGEWSFEAASDFVGETSVYVKAFDGQSFSRIARIRFSIAQVDTGAVIFAFDDFAEASLNSSIVSQLRARPAAVGAFKVISQPAHGALALDPPSGRYTFSPDYLWFGETSFTFRYVTQEGTSAVATARLRINPLAPVAQNIMVQGRSSITGTLLANDPNGLPLRYAIWRSLSNGTVSLDAQTGQFTFVPNARYFGETTFEFVADNNHETSEPKTVTVKVLPLAPTVANVTFSGTIGGPVVGHLEAFDPQGLPVALFAGSSYDGVVAVNSATGDFIFEPAYANWRGTTSFQYWAQNSAGMASNNGVVTIGIGVGDASLRPRANDIVKVLSPYQLWQTSVSLSGYDPGGRSLVYSITSMPEIVQSHYLNPYNGGLILSFGSQFPEGIAAVNYKVNNGLEDSDIGTVSLVYERPTWATPVAVATARVDTEIFEDTAYVGRLLASGGDGKYRFSEVHNSGKGLVSIDASTGQFTATPIENFSGTWFFTLGVEDTFGHSASTEYWLSVKPVNDAPISGDVAYNLLEGEETVGYLPGYDVDGDHVTYRLLEAPTVGTVSIDEGSGIFVYQPIPGWYGQAAFSFAVSDGLLETQAHTAILNVAPGGVQQNIPPDPATIAPPADCCLPTDFYSSNAFLFTHATPVQYGIAATAVDTARMAVVRGRVLGPQGVPLVGAKVRPLAQPALGYTISRNDGAFDLVVNGGGTVTLKIEKAGYLPIERKIDTPWLGFVSMEDVVLTPLDASVTAIELGAASSHVHVASTKVDASGARSAVLLFPPNLQAHVRLTDGTRNELSGTVHVRATEFTVGEHGPAAMPAVLPPASAYTYALEFSFDEAMVDNVSTIEFNKPVISYNENFLNLPVGMVIPVGYYERREYDSGWKAERNGRIVRVVDIVDGLAVLDLDGDGLGDLARYADFGITDDERQTVASLYAPGATVWRVALHHFSPFDYNFFSFIPGKIWLVAPGTEDPNVGEEDQCPGSILCMQTQSLGEKAAIQGSDIVLRYDSRRTGANVDSFKKTFSLVPGVVPNMAPWDRYVNAKKVRLITTIEGRREERLFEPAPGLSYEYSWDGKDAYGRALLGIYELDWRIGWEYQLEYASLNTDLDLEFLAFGMMPNIQILDHERINDLIGRINFVVWQTGKSQFETWRNSVVQFGGWSIDAQHAYDKQAAGGGALFQGDGLTRSAKTQAASVFTFGGDNSTSYAEENVPAKETGMQPTDLVVMADGSVVFGDSAGNRIRRIDKGGMVTTIAGNGAIPEVGDVNVKLHGRALGFALDRPIRLAKGADDTIYFLENSGRLNLLRPDGTLATVVTRVPNGFSQSDEVIYGGMAIDRDGFVIVAATTARAVWKISPAGDIQRLVGDGSFVFNFPEETFAGDAGIGAPGGVAISPDNEIFFSDSIGGRLYKIAADGRLYRVHGGGVRCRNMNGGEIIGENTEFGGGYDIPYFGSAVCSSKFASEKMVWGPRGLVFANAEPFGMLMSYSSVSWPGVLWDTYINAPRGDNPQQGIHLLEPGVGATPLVDVTENIAEFTEGVSALRTYGAQYFSVAPDGTIFFVAGRQILKAVSPYARVPGAVMSIASASGSSNMLFDEHGRHIQSVDPVSGVKQRAFRYDGNGLVVGISDGDGNETVVERASSGTLLAFVSPYGHRTRVELDANGYLAALIDEAGNRKDFSYTPNGLMLTYVDPNRGTHLFEYNAYGKLTKDTSPSGSFQALVRSELNVTYQDRLAKGNSFEVALEDGEGNETKFVQKRSDLSKFKVLRTRTDATGVQESEYSGGDGSRTIHPDGTTVNVSENPDPRFGSQAPLLETSISTPGGVVSFAKHKREFTPVQGNPDMPARIIDRIETDHGISLSDYNGITRERVTVSPRGRVVTTSYNLQGRPSTTRFGDQVPTAWRYDTRGRLVESTRGGRTSTFTYGSNGKVSTITDPLDRSTSFEYDLADRMVRSELPGGRTIEYDYDPNGNLVSVRPPGRPVHEFTYSSFDGVLGYFPPNVGANSATTYEYDTITNKLDAVHLPDGSSIGYNRDAAGRVVGLSHARGFTSFNYDYSSGHLASVADPGGEVVTLGYDGSLIKSISFSGPVMGTVNFNYEQGMRLHSESVVAGAGFPSDPFGFPGPGPGPGGESEVVFGYDNDGLLTLAGALTIDRSNKTGQAVGSHLDGMHAYSAYNTFGEAVGYSATHAGGFAITASYARDQLGRIVSKTEAVNGLRSTYDYRFDDAGRLTHVDRDGQPWSSYTYDLNGNRLSHTGVSSSATGVYDDQDRLVSYGGFTYSYSPLGALASKTQTSSGQTWSYAYDSFGNLTQVQLPDGSTIDYVVDGLNRRVGKQFNGMPLKGYLYRNQLQVIAELDGFGGLVSQFVYGTKANVPDYMIRNGERYQLIHDQVGSVRFVVHAQYGYVAQELVYDEFGNVVMDTNPGFQPFGFAGGLYDADSGLVRFGARDYDPLTGRWTAKDPILFNGGDTNLYGYVLNDPINLVDPNGLIVPQLVGMIVGGAVGGTSASINGTSVLAGIGVGAGAGLLATLNPLGLSAFSSSIVMGGVGGGVGNLAGQLLGSDPVNVNGVIAGTISGALGGGLGYGATNVINTGFLDDMLTEYGEETFTAATSGIIAGLLDPLTQALLADQLAEGCP